MGKSSILNALDPAFGLATGEISEKLGRGRHTTRHVELFPWPGAHRRHPGFSAFDNEKGRAPGKEALAETFREFRPYLDQCRFIGCAHVKGGRLRGAGGPGGGEDPPQPPPELRPPV